MAAGAAGRTCAAGPSGTHAAPNILSVAKEKQTLGKTKHTLSCRITHAHILKPGCCLIQKKKSWCVRWSAKSAQLQPMALKGNRRRLECSRRRLESNRWQLEGNRRRLETKCYSTKTRFFN